MVDGDDEILPLFVLPPCRQLCSSTMEMTEATQQCLETNLVDTLISDLVSFKINNFFNHVDFSG